MRPRSFAAWLLLTPPILLPTGLAHGHGDTHRQISALDRRIQRSPDKPELLLKRGELHAVHGDHKPALEDFDRALSINPTLHQARLARARALLSAGELDGALADTARVLDAEVWNSAAWALQARIFDRQGRHDLAATNLDRAIKTSSRPSPELFLWRARALVAAGRSKQARRSLDEALTRLGPLVVLEKFAIELEIKAGNVQGAVDRVNQIIERSKRKENWLARRGDILSQAGRLKEARESYEAALASISALRSKYRETKRIKDLERELREKLGTASLAMKKGDILQ